MIEINFLVICRLSSIPPVRRILVVLSWTQESIPAGGREHYVPPILWRLHYVHHRCQCYSIRTSWLPPCGHDQYPRQCGLHTEHYLGCNERTVPDNIYNGVSAEGDRHGRIWTAWIFDRSLELARSFRCSIRVGSRRSWSSRFTICIPRHRIITNARMRSIACGYFVFH